MKKNSITTLLLIAFTSTAFGMEPEQPNKKWWVSYAADAILYGTDALSDFLSFISLEPTKVYPPESKFTSLPQEAQQTIIAFLLERKNARTLKDIARSINSLAQVNKQLHELINHPVFCLQIIKHLSQQFDCSDETAAAALQTQEAKHRLAVQKQFEQFFMQENFDQASFDKLYRKYKNYIDLNFTYRSFKDPKYDTKNTLLITIAEGNNFTKNRKIICLLNTNLIDVNYQNRNGETALMQCIFTRSNSKILTLLATPLNINLQDSTQSTALHYACSQPRNDKYDYIEILLNAGADPEIIAMEGLTPLILINQYGDNDEIELIQNAIEKNMKKNNSLLTLLLIAFTSTTFGMEPEQPKRKWWIPLAASVILHSSDALKEFLSYIYTNQNSVFTDLSPEEQKTIIFLLSESNNATTLAEAAHAINSLAQVNQQLNAVINDPEFCLNLIKSLAQQFDCSNETVTLALQTKETKKRLAVQKKFEILFSRSNYFDPIVATEQPVLYDFSVKKFEKLYNLYKNYVDLNFTYRNFQSPQYDDKDTLLINSAAYPSPYKTIKISSLFDKVDINYQNAQYETALMKCATNCDNPAALKLLCDAPNIHIDLLDENSNTALMRVCLIKVSPQREVREKSNKAICISLLLRAGADPEKINSYGQTPLTLLKSMGNNEIEIKLIQDAINKKNAPRSQKSTTTNKRLNKK